MLDTNTSGQILNLTGADQPNSTLGNDTGEMVVIPDIHPAFEKLIIVLYVLVIVLALMGNGCVIYLVLSQRQMRNVTNYFIASLATSDALMALVCIPVTFISNVLVDSWPFPAWMCPFATYMQVVVVFQNAFTFVAISMERYIAIMYPFRKRLSRCQCYLVIAITWFMSLATPLPTAIVSRLHEVETEDPNVTHSFCFEVWPLEGQRFSYSMTIMVLQYFVPLAVLTYTYIRIVVVVWLKDSPPHGRMGGVVSSGRPVFLPQDSNMATTGLGGMDNAAGSGQYVDPRKRTARNLTQTARDLTQTARDLTQTARDLTQTARDLTQTARDLTQTARDLTQTARDLTQTARDLTQTARDLTQTARDLTRLRVT